MRITAATRLIAPHVLLGLAFTLLVGCSSGGSGGSSEGTLAGEVLSPGGDAHRLAAPLGGLSPVPDGTTVDLVRLDDRGEVLERLATTETRRGRYSFDLPALGVELAVDLAVTTGSGAGLMRALAVKESLDLDPLSEAEVRVVLRQDEGLMPFTLEEIRDLDTSVRLLCASRELAAGPDVETTAGLVVDAVLAEAGLSAFVGSSAEPGQTTAGPGDVGDYFPSRRGNLWSYAGTIKRRSDPSVSYESAVRVVDLDTEGTASFREENGLGTGATIVTRFEKTSRAVVHLGMDPVDRLAAAVSPYKEIRFPLREGDHWLQYDAENVAIDDLDLDGRDELADVRAERTVVGFESVMVDGGSLAHAARIDTDLRTTIHLSTGRQGTSTLKGSEWYAPGLGLVKRAADIEIGLAGRTIRQRVEERIANYHVGGAGRGILPPWDLAVELETGNSNTNSPGRPGLASDGSDFLMVTCREQVASARLVALRVAQSGFVEEEIELATLASRECGSATPKVSFDGTSYLVVYSDAPVGQYSRLYAMRISPLGEILDPGGFQIGTIGASHPSLAFDGNRHLVVWLAPNLYGPGTEIRGAFVAPDRTVTDELPIHAYAGDLSSPSVVFGEAEFLVLWTMSSYDEADVRGARVTTAGTVLDPLGIDVATGPLDEERPTASFDGDRFFVVWTRDPSPNQSGADIAAAFFERDGTPSALAPLTIATNDWNVNPEVDFDGTRHVVAWGIESYDPPSEIRVARVTPAGELLDDPPGIAIETNYARSLLCQPAMAHNGSSLLITWLVNGGGYDAPKGISGTLIYSFDP